MKCHFNTIALLSILFFCPIRSLAADSFSSSTVNITDSHTSIRIESNGEVKTYESDNPGNIVVESNSGSAKAKAVVNTSDVNLIISPLVTKIIQKPTVTYIPSSTLTTNNQLDQTAPGILSKIRSFFKKFFIFRFKPN